MQPETSVLTKPCRSPQLHSMRGARAVTQEDFRLPNMSDDREACDAVVEDPRRCSVREGHQLEKAHHEDVSHSSGIC